MEWKRAKGGVSVERCDDSLSDRISISGDYSSHECGITVTQLQVEDAETWECEMEEYRFGDWVKGYKNSKSMTVRVVEATTTKTTTTTTTTTTQKTTTPINTYEIDTTSETEYITEDVDKTIKESDADDNNEELQIRINDEDIEALPVEDKATQEVSPGIIIGCTAVAVTMIVIAAIVGWVVKNKRNKSVTIVSLDTDDHLAANAFLEEAEYHISIIKEPQELQTGF